MDFQLAPRRRANITFMHDLHAANPLFAQHPVDPLSRERTLAPVIWHSQTLAPDIWH